MLTILFNYAFFSFLLIDLDFLTPVNFTQIFNPTGKLVIPIGTPVKEGKTEIETHSVTVETKISRYTI